MSRNPLWTRCLLACYPAHWRQRYADEYAALLSDTLRHASRTRRPALIVNVLRGALDARLNPKGTPMADRRNAPTTTAIRATGLFTIAAAGFHKMIDDTTLITAARNDTSVGWSLTLLNIATAIAFLAVITTALPAAGAMLRGQANGTFKYLAVPPLAAALWVGLAHLLADGRSTQTTPDITAVLVLSSGAIAVVAATAWSAGTVLRRVPADLAPRLRPLTLGVLAAAMAATTLACLAWGLAVHAADPTGFTSHTDGLFATPFTPSWAATIILMATATAFAAKASLRQQATPTPA